MRKSKILLGALAALSMGFYSCSNEDAPNAGGGTTFDGDRYVAVRIQSVGSNGTRAEEFEPGIENENNISAENIRFYFFTADKRPFVMSMTGVNGEVSNTNMVKPISITQDNLTDGTATSINGVLVLGTEAEGYKGNEPKYVVCVANPTSNIPFEDFANQTMDKLLNIKADAPDNLTAESSFVMTSSSYVDGQHVYFTDLTGKIKESAAAAQGEPADIFIERLASKVRVTGIKEWAVKEKVGNNLQDATFNIHVINNGVLSVEEDVKLNIELTGWRLRNLAMNNYAIKNLKTEWISNPPYQNWIAWNDATLHRSYWTSPSSQTENDIQLAGFDIENSAQFSLKNWDNTAPKNNLAYCYENDFQPASASDRENHATAIVVRGVVKNTTSNEAIKLCKWGGDYYTEDALKQVFVNSYNENKNEADKKTANDVKFKPYTQTGAQSNTWYAYIDLGDDGEVHNNYRFSNISRWVDGQTSYVVNIKHATLPNGDALYGVVRNHIYEYEFTNVVGLGVPGNDPKNPDPEKETYLAARVHVLNWHLVRNSIVLE